MDVLRFSELQNVIFRILQSTYIDLCISHMVGRPSRPTNVFGFLVHA